MELARNLNRICKERGITLSSLARISGVKQPTLFGWSTGRAVHNLDDLKKVCGVLRISLHEILFGEPDPHQGDGLIEELRWGKLTVRLYKAS